MRIVKNTFDLFAKPILKISEAFRGSNKSFKQIFIDSYTNFKHQFSETISKLKDLQKANLELGKHHYDSGNLSDAKVRFHILRIFFKNAPAEIYYYLGRSYFEQGQFKPSSKYLDIYLNKGDSKFKSEAEFTKKILDNDVDNIKEIPDSLLIHQFDALAPIYNDIYIIDNHKCIQNFIIHDLKKTLSDNGKPFGNKLLDLGCGTGYIGKQLKAGKATSHATAVDISPKMIAMAKRLKADDLKVYDDLHTSNVSSYLKNTKETFDIIVASQLMNHISNWHNIAEQCINKLNKNGVFVFTFKVFGEKSGSIFDRYTEEFLHSGDEIMSKLKKLKNCSILTSKPLTFELENDTGFIIIKRK